MREITLKYHALFDTLLKSTILAAIPLGLGDFAGTIRHTSVNPPVLNRPFEEPFTSLAGDYAVVQTGGLILTYHTH